MYATSNGKILGKVSECSCINFNGRLVKGDNVSVCLYDEYTRSRSQSPVASTPPLMLTLIRGPPIQSGTERRDQSRGYCVVQGVVHKGNVPTHASCVFAVFFSLFHFLFNFVYFFHLFTHPFAPLSLDRRSSFKPRTRSSRRK